MKFVGIAGSVSADSYNRQLLAYIAGTYGELADIEILDLTGVPMFSQDHDATDSPLIQYLNRKIAGADGVILVTPEHNHTTTPVMKNVIEWLSYQVHPFTDKPVLIVGASYHDQGSSRAQVSLRQIMEAPGVGALVMPGDEFLLANVKSAFDAAGKLKDEDTAHFLDQVMHKFKRWVETLASMQKPVAPWADEDLGASGHTDTTLDIPMDAPDWVEQGAAQQNAASGDQYVNLDRGLLTVNQLNYFLNSMPMELTFVDENNQFIYYNHMMEKEDMMASRDPQAVGQPMGVCHPERAHENVQRAVWLLRSGETDLFKLPVPGNRPNEKWIMHYYQAMRDAEGTYRGVNEWVLDIWPIVQEYLTYTHQSLVPAAGAVDASTGASTSAAAPDASTSASTHDEPVTVPDASTGASEH